jgi:hypothetical protein
MLRQRGRVGLMTAALVTILAGVAGASEGTSTDESKSILVFPKVIANGSRDTIIQISNTSNLPAFAHCFYVNAALRFPDDVCESGTCKVTGVSCNVDRDCEGPDNPRLWQEIDFDIQLTAKQPTHWVVSTGRLADPFDEPCENFFGKSRCQSCSEEEAEEEEARRRKSCDGAGIDPGRVPPVPPDFVGELKCVEVDGMLGTPFPGDDLKGLATIITLDDGDVSKYNAIGFDGLNPPSLEAPDLTNLCLGTSDHPEYCPFGPEYSGCPQFWVIDHFGEHMSHPVFGESYEVTTDLTIVPCTQNFETQDPETVTLFIESWDEFEIALSAFVQVTCWEDIKLSEIDPFAFSGPTFRQTRMRPTSQSRSGVLMVGEEVHAPYHGNNNNNNNNNSNGGTARAAFNPHMEGERALDLITIPADQLIPPPTF